MDRHWFTTVRSLLFRSVKIHDQNTATRRVNSSRRRRSREIRRSDQQIEGRIWLYFAVDSPYLGEFFGSGRRKEKKISILLESLCLELIPASVQFKDIQEKFSLIHFCKTIYCYRVTSPSTSTTSGTPTRCIPLLKVDWSLEEKASEGTDSQCSSQLWTRLTFNLIEEKLSTWRSHHNTVFWCSLQLAQRKGLRFYQNSTARNHSFRHHQRFVSTKWSAWKQGKNFTAKHTGHPGYHEWHLCRTSSTFGKVYMFQNREKFPWPWKRSAQGNLWQWILYWFAILGIPHSAVEQVETNRKEKVPQ